MITLVVALDAVAKRVETVASRTRVGLRQVLRVAEPQATYLLAEEDIVAWLMRPETARMIARTRALRELDVAEAFTAAACAIEDGKARGDRERET